MSSAKSIVRKVTNNSDNGLKQLKEHSLDRKHPQHIKDYSFTKIFQPKFQTENKIAPHLSEPPIPNIILKNSIGV